VIMRSDPQHLTIPQCYVWNPDEDHPRMGTLRPTRWISRVTDL
jgi:hypothetical protein